MQQALQPKVVSKQLYAHRQELVYARVEACVDNACACLYSDPCVRVHERLDQ